MTNPVTKVVPVKRVNQGQPGGKTTDMAATLESEKTKSADTKSPTKKSGDGSTTKLTDGFHLLIDALKLNDLNTIYGVPGIPITDFGRMAQANGMRVLSFRHEQNAGNAAAIAGYLTKKPGLCLTVSAPGFLNGLTALSNATTNCFPMILMSGSSERGHFAKPRFESCMPKISGSLLRVLTVQLSRVVQGASTWTCLPSSSGRPWMRWRDKNPWFR